MSDRRVRFLTPVVTVVLAFVVGGLVVLASSANPLVVYRSMFVGAGFDWPFHLLPGNPFGVNEMIAASNLQSTLVEATPLVLTGLAVAFAFRCGMFNIGGQGQFWIGSTAAFLCAEHVAQNQLGTWLGVLAGMIAGMVWGAIPGFLKAFRGAHEVITTIMLNWIAIFMVSWLFGLNGPFVGEGNTQPISDTLPDTAWLPTIWGVLQPVTAGLFVALAAAFVYGVILRRTTLGFAVRAVGFNADAARYAGISVRRSMVLAMALSGGFAGLAGSVSVLGTDHRITSLDVFASQLGFTGIAVALLGRNTPLGVVLGALLFAALDAGARNLGGDFSPELARSLATVIQGTIILIVGGEQVVRWAFVRRRRALANEAAG